MNIVDFPHTVRMVYKNANSKWKCSGSLISDQWILTAASCRVKNVRYILLGTDNIRKPFLKIEIELRIDHELYNENNRHNDIALIKLAQIVPLSTMIYPACLHIDGNSPAEGINLSVTGFGRQNRLRRGTVQVSTNDKCYYYTFINQICTKNLQTNQDVCSGGKLLKNLF